MTDRDLDALVDILDLDLPFAAILGRHGMQPDRRHTLCGFDLTPAGLPAPDGGFLVGEIECPACLDVLGAIG